jgi:hypothetical protein
MLKVAGGGGGGSGTVTQINTGEGLTGGPITSSGTIALAVPVSIADGGTNSTATPTSGTVAYGNGTSYLFTAAGTAGQYLQSTGSGAPTWSTPPSNQNVVINSSTITNGTGGYILYDNAGTIGEKAVSGTGNVVLVTSSTLSNVNISSVAVTFPNSYLANSTATLGNATITLGGTTSTVGNLTLNNVTIGSGNSTITTENASYINVSTAIRTQALTGYLYGNANTGNVTAATTIPNAGLANSTATLGNATITLGSTTTSVGNLTLANANITSVAATFPNSYLANSTATLGNATVTLGSTTSTVGNLTLTLPTVTNYVESQVAIGNSGTSQSISLTNGTVQTVTLTGNCTFTMPTAANGKSFILILSTGAGSFTSTFTSVKWPGNTAPTITTTATRWDIITFVSDGTNWYGNYAQGYT